MLKKIVQWTALSAQSNPNEVGLNDYNGCLAANPLSQKGYEERSTTIPLRGSKTASDWRKKNTASRRDEDIVCAHVKA